jgi:hypothetical protein
MWGNAGLPLGREKLFRLFAFTARGRQHDIPLGLWDAWVILACPISWLFIFLLRPVAPFSDTVSLSHYPKAYKKPKKPKNPTT